VIGMPDHTEHSTIGSVRPAADAQLHLKIAVIAFGAGTVEPGDFAIGAGDVAVGADGDVDDDFSGGLHGVRPKEFGELQRPPVQEMRASWGRSRRSQGIASRHG